MRKSTKRAPELQAKINKSRADARDRVVKDGTVQFRLDAEMMELLLRVSQYKRTPSGVLARLWVVERLRDEAARADISMEQKAATS